MRQFLLSLFGSIIGFFIALGLLAIFFVAIIGAIASSVSSKDAKINTPKVLTLDLRHKMLDHSGENSLFGKSKGSLVGTVRALGRAKDDASVKGLLIRANGWAVPVQQAEELRLALIDFKKNGKFIITHAQGFEGTSPSAYMAVSASDEIWLQESTTLSMAGYRAEIEFLGGVFEKFDAKPEFIQFHEYKNAVNSYTKKKLDGPHREAMTAILTSLMDQSVNNIATDRDLTSQSVRDFMDQAPHTSQAAKQAGYVTDLGYFFDAKDQAKSLAKGDSKDGGKKKKDKDDKDEVTFQSVSAYGTGDPSGPLIAFVGGEGPVLNGSSSDGSNPLSNSVTMGSDTVAKAIMDASKNKRVKAIVFRVSSPGGSPSASDQIWDAVRRAKKAGKPVVVSMGQYAASGGYYVSANADKIVAMPSTLTGSIGVFGGKIAIGDTLAKIGYSVDTISIGGDYSAVFSPFEPWNQKSRQTYKEVLSGVYDDFTTRVSDGRNIPLERVLEIAKGRVWTGVQAKEIGLVDELGGINKAIQIAKELANIDADKSVRIKKYPRELTPGEQIEQLFNASAEAGANMQMLGQITASPEFAHLLKLQAKTATNRKDELHITLPTID